MLCPKCKNKLIELKIRLEDGTIKEFYSHPVTAAKCDYSDDGTRLEIVDEILCNRFQELIKEEGILDPISEKSPLNDTGKKGSESNLEAIQRRLSFGEISIIEFDELKKRLE